jgi:hypothetical protein
MRIILRNPSGDRSADTVTIAVRESQNRFRRCHVDSLSRQAAREAEPVLVMPSELSQQTGSQGSRTGSKYATWALSADRQPGKQNRFLIFQVNFLSRQAAREAEPHCKSGSHKNGIRKSSRKRYNHIMGI